jgi:TusA-related sulfurtransferase
MRNVLRSKALWAVVLPIAFAGAAFAGANCDHGKGEATGKRAHCNLEKKVVKEAKMTDDGAIVTLKGKNATAVSHIKEHLAAHADGEDCPGCPLSMEGVTTKVEMSDDGGTLTVSGSSPESIKAIQEWASKPAGACCKHGEHADKA